MAAPVVLQRLNEFGHGYALLIKYKLLNDSQRVNQTDCALKGWPHDSHCAAAGDGFGFFYTAVQQMTDGDLWKVYIPNKLGYGASGSTGVPAYSTLVFDINLVSFSR
jgi:hypothetical protein